MKLRRITLRVALAFVIAVLAVMGFGVTVSFGAVDPAEIVKLKPRYAGDGVFAGNSFQVGLEVTVSKGWHISSNAPSYEFAIPTEIRLVPPDGFRINEIIYPPPSGTLPVPDGGTTELFDGSFVVILRGAVNETVKTGTYAIPGTFSFQGCNDETCLRPIDKEFTFDIRVVPLGTVLKPLDRNAVSVPVHATQTKTSSADGGDISRMVTERGLAVTLVLIFLGGLALNLTPCVYPLIPITISYFGSRTGRSSPVPSALAYVLGIAFMYSSLGTAAAATGGMFGALLTNPVVLLGIAGVMVALSLSMFGLYEFRLPTALMNVGGSARSGVVGAFVMGLTMGIVAAPCIGPFVFGLLTYVATLGSPVLGFVMFFALSMGLGLPYLFLGIFSGKISALPRAGQWMMGIRHLFGVILLIMAVYFLAPLFPERLKDLALAGALVAGGAGLIIFDWSGRDSRFFHVIKSSAAVAMVVVGMWMYKPAPDNGVTLPWQTYSDTALSDAEAGHRPVIIDFFADWCIPCKELDAVTFKDPRVTDFRNDFVFLKADLSREGTEAVARLRNRFGILGVPTIVFIGAEGKEWEDLRLTGFEEPALFADRMKKALEPKKPAASEKETQ